MQEHQQEVLTMHALRLAEVLARRLSSDPSVVACFRDRLPDNEIDKYAIVLTREKLATKALATDADVDKTIAAKISEIWAEVRDGKWRVVYYDRGKGHPVYLSDAHLVSPPPLLSALANQLGRVGNGHARFEDVMLERVREHVEEPAKEAVVQPETEPPVMDGNDNQDKVNALHEIWALECRNASFVPSREDDLKLARQVFEFLHLSDLVRKARRVITPEWKRSGPKRVKRKDSRHSELVDSLIERTLQSWQGRPK